MELAGIICMQALLCVFNVFVTWRSFAGWLRNRKAAAAAAAAKNATKQCYTAGNGAHGAAGPEKGVHSMQPPIAHVSVAGVLQQWSVPQQGIAAEKATAQQAYGRRQGSAARQLL